MARKEYGIRKMLVLPWEAALERTREKLQEEGFGILTEIDIRAKLKEKLGVDYRRYVILGACNPPLAYEALQAEPEVGLLLPCNVIVYEESEGRTVVSAIDPWSMVEVVGESAGMEKVARDARERLERVIRSL
ncbi:MAG TPA: DUF302 domain-containing protein [Longimicrobiales bacterium]|nr:DUF302 domain-containing protein [Longimicrobiales bacterium]